MMSIACVLEQMAITVLREQWKCIVMVTHSQHDAAYANRTINVFDGEVVENTIL